jgi:hypothetical protein
MKVVEYGTTTINRIESMGKEVARSAVFPFGACEIRIKSIRAFSFIMQSRAIWVRLRGGVGRLCPFPRERIQEDQREDTLTRAYPAQGRAFSSS